MVKRAAGALLLSIGIDHQARRPVSTQLYVSLRDMILSGGFAAGERLPATRTMARDLGLSRTTIIEAFERLTAEGLIEARTGSGTYVSAVLAMDRPKVAGHGQVASGPHQIRLSKAIAQATARFSERQRLPFAPRAFTTALPAFDAFPMAQWARLSAKHWRGDRDNVMGYGEPSGHPQLRRAIAAHLRANRGITCEADQIFIVGGAQQAFHLIGSILLDPGDKVWFENPGAIGARNSLIASGADLVPVPVDRDGLRVDDGVRAAPDFRLAFVTPSHHQPLGTVMSLERRFALLRAAEQAGAWIIEDDYDGEFFFGVRPPPTLKSVDTAGLVIYVGTFSKSLFPSIRLGFILSPPALAETFRSLMSKFLYGVPTSPQAVVAEFIDEGHFTTHIRRMRRIYAERHEALCHAATRHLRGLLTVVPTASGLHTIGHLLAGVSELDAAVAADESRITVSPIARFSIAPSPARGLVLGFGGVTPSQITAGVRVLATVLERLAGRGGRLKSASRPAHFKRRTEGRVTKMDL
jgi:GntR family transcriptional regulator/MocR family aminotransferase